MIESEPIGKYLEELASGAPTPGGGAAAALTLGQAAALLSMVCHFTLGREKYQAAEKQIRAVLDHANGVRQLALEAANADVKAYQGVRDAFALPKPLAIRDNDRADAIERALENAATVPWRLAEYCEQLHDQALALRPVCNQNLVSDVDVALCLIQAAVGALWINVDVNLKGMRNKAFGDGLKLKISNAMRRIRSFEPEPVRALLVG